LLRIHQDALYDRSAIGFSADAILGDRQPLLPLFTIIIAYFSIKINIFRPKAKKKSYLFFSLFSLIFSLEKSRVAITDCAFDFLLWASAKTAVSPSRRIVVSPTRHSLVNDTPCLGDSTSPKTVHRTVFGSLPNEHARRTHNPKGMGTKMPRKPKKRKPSNHRMVI
jgi:hypothetical protein